VADRDESDTTDEFKVWTQQIIDEFRANGEKEQ
jgi:hypothetical protein